jgi:hypothetical protein
VSLETVSTGSPSLIPGEAPVIPWKTPYVPRAYPNRVDVVGKSYTEDSEGGRVEVETVIASDIACSLQQASPRMLEDLGLAGVAQAKVVAFFHATQYPGIAADQELQQTDSAGPQRLVVVGVSDLGGLHTDFACACDYVGR